MRMHHLPREEGPLAAMIIPIDGAAVDVLYPDSLSCLQGYDNTAPAGADTGLHFITGVLVGKAYSIHDVVEQTVPPRGAVHPDLKPVGTRALVSVLIIFGHVQW